MLQEPSCSPVDDNEVLVHPPFVSTGRGSATDLMLDGVIPSSPLGFKELLTTPPPITALAAPPHRHRVRPTPPALPRCNSRLMKKVVNSTPTVAAA
jgi:hypothetical protein